MRIALDRAVIISDKYKKEHNIDNNEEKAVF